MIANDTRQEPAGKEVRVSVVIPVYNRAVYLREAIESILGQTFGNFEIVVVDDASTDGSAEVAASFGDSRIRILGNARNSGISASRNAGIAAARGEYVAFLDSDDKALPRRLERQVEFLDRHPHCAAVSGWVFWIDEHGKRVGQGKLQAMQSDVLRAEAFFRCPLRTPAAMARTTVLQANPCDLSYVVAGDFELWSRIAAEHEIANIPFFLGECRTHPARTVRTSGDQIRLETGRRLYRGKLARLGVTFSEEDLDRHRQLGRTSSGRTISDESYVDWAEQWLLALERANKSAGAYPEPFFSNTLRELWLGCCWSRRRAGVVEMVRRWRRSPLSRPISPVLRNYAALYTQRRRVQWFGS